MCYNKRVTFCMFILVVNGCAIFCAPFIFLETCISGGRRGAELHGFRRLVELLKKNFLFKKLALASNLRKTDVGELPGEDE